MERYVEDAWEVMFVGVFFEDVVEEVTLAPPFRALVQHWHKACIKCTKQIAKRNHNEKILSIGSGRSDHFIHARERSLNQGANSKIC